jgi:hypothetical protein
MYVPNHNGNIKILMIIYILVNNDTICESANFEPTLYILDGA